MQLMRGETMQKWYVYRHPERDYVRQVTAEQKQEGEWKLREGHPHNHLFDCEVLQLLAATIDGVIMLDGVGALVYGVRHGRFHVQIDSDREERNHYSRHYRRDCVCSRMLRN
jgi:hypothetical protein